MTTRSDQCDLSSCSKFYLNVGVDEKQNTFLFTYMYSKEKQFANKLMSFFTSCRSFSFTR